MQKTLNPKNFIDQMHENEFKCFPKTLEFNPELRYKDF